ncbi:hypothetical protein OIU76_023654 [Salix suchowensis]|nr:hypothetical protein OIU76_023654 [Salix suchowensis]
MADSLEVMNLGRSMKDQAGPWCAPGSSAWSSRSTEKRDDGNFIDAEFTETRVGARSVHSFHDLVEILYVLVSMSTVKFSSCVFAVTELLCQTWKYVLMIMSYVPIGEAVIMPERSSPFENSPSGQSYWLGNEFGVIGLSI